MAASAICESIAMFFLGQPGDLWQNVNGILFCNVWLWNKHIMLLFTL